MYVSSGCRPRLNREVQQQYTLLEASSFGLLHDLHCTYGSIGSSSATSNTRRRQGESSFAGYFSAEHEFSRFARHWDMHTGGMGED